MVSIGARAGAWSLLDLALIGNGTAEPWRTVTTLFVYSQTGYEIVALAVIFLFGWLLERRHGLWAPLLVFLRRRRGRHVPRRRRRATRSSRSAATAPRSACSAAWAVRDLLGAPRAAIEDDADMLGVLAIAVVVVLLPLASPEASAVAGLGGGADRPDPRPRPLAPALVA